MVGRREIVLIGLALLVGACSSTQPGGLVPHTDRSGFLADYTALQKGKSGQPLYVYENPGADLSKFDDVLLEPVHVWRGSESGASSATKEELQLVADYFYTVLYQRLAQDYQMVSTPTSHTMRVRVAIRKVGETDTSLQVVSTSVPQPNLIPKLKNMADRPAKGTGAASVEALVLDAHTSEILWAGIEAYSVDPSQEGALTTWKQVERTLKFDSEAIAYRLCLKRGSRQCVQPHIDRME